MKKQKILWIVVFTVLVATLGQMQVLATDIPSLREQLGIKKLPTTEKEVLQFAGRFLSIEEKPVWTGIDKKLVKRTFAHAFDGRGKIRSVWVKEFQQIMVQEKRVLELNSKKHGKLYEFTLWRFYRESKHGAPSGVIITKFTIKKSSDPIKIIYTYSRP